VTHGDYNTTSDLGTNEGLLVFKRSVSLKVEVFQKKLTVNEQAKIDNLREQDAKDLKIKEARKLVKVIDIQGTANIKNTAEASVALNRVLDVLHVVA
jgi:hypothetical protein